MIVPAWAALVFSSYYLAYFSCFTTAAFVAAILVADRRTLGRAAPVGAALAVPLATLAAFSLPYLDARAPDLVHARDTLLLQRYPGRPLYLLRTRSSDVGSPLMLEPLSLDSARAEWATGAAPASSR